MKKKYNFLSKFIICVLPLILSACSFSFEGFSNFSGFFPNPNSSNSGNSSIDHPDSETDINPDTDDLEQYIRELDKTKIKVAYSDYMGLDETEYITHTIEKFNSNISNPKKKFEVEFEGQVNVGSLRANANTEDVFDIILMPQSDIYSFDLINSNLIKELPEQYANYVKETNYDFAYKSAIEDDSIYAFTSYLTNGYFMWRNENYLSGQESLEEILMIARENGKKVMLNVSSPWYVTSYLFSPEGCGKDSFRTVKNGNEYMVEVTWDQQKSVDHLAYLQTLFLKYKNYIVDETSGDIVSRFNANEIIAGFCGTWVEESFKNAGLNHVKTSPLPYYVYEGNQCQLANFCDSCGYVVTSCKNDAKKEKTAMALAYLLTSRESQKEGIKIRNNLISTNKELSYDKEYMHSLNETSNALLGQCIKAGINQHDTVRCCYDYWSTVEAIGTTLQGTRNQFEPIQNVLIRLCDYLRSQKYY